MVEKQYYPSINLLRGIAALMVCVFHFTAYEDMHGSLFEQSSWTYQIGQFGLNGVYVFFVITGFVIPLSLYKSKFVFSMLPRFLTKRWIRIEIPYLVSMLLVLTVGFVFSLKNNEAFSIEFMRIVHHVFYTIPFTSYDWYNSIYWTLAIEFQYYILIAFMFPLLISQTFWIKILTLIIFGALPFVVTDTRLVFYFAPIFLMGMVLFLWKTNQLRIEWFIVFIGALFWLTMTVNGLAVAIAGISTTYVIGYVDINKKLFNRFGDISYSLYLTHGLIGGNLLYLLNRYTTNYTASFFLMLAAIILSLVVSFFFWKWIEQPSKKLSKIKA